MSDGSADMPLAVAAKVDAHYHDAQVAAEKHVAKVAEFHARLDECSTMDEIELLGDDPAFAPFCGCETCYIREVLHAALPHLEKAVLVEWGLTPRR